MKKWLIILAAALVIVLSVGLYLVYQNYLSSDGRTRQVIEYLQNPDMHQDLVIPALSRCVDAPFIMPSTGMIGYIWDDSFRLGHRHQGIDIFSGTDVGETPVYAAYDGFLTRLADWKSSIIIRIASDPLQPERQIWTYYTHLADAEGNSLIDDAFPPGTDEIFVTAGTLLGFQGNYSGTPGSPTGVHLHFSIVKDDGEGMFLNELEIENTLDPSLYFGLALNAHENPSSIPVCGVD